VSKEKTQENLDLVKDQEVISISDADHYRCIKYVHAIPMTFGEYEKYRTQCGDLCKCGIPATSADYADSADGYLVMYNEGEYRSWSPKAA